VQDHALALELDARAIAELVVAERREEQRLAAEIDELDGRDSAAASCLRPNLRGVDDVARARDGLDARELDPLDMSNDGGLHARHSLASSHASAAPCVSKG
jgi:hypothetical protein